MADEDRDAILERRRRLAVVALSGLSTFGCDARSQPCLTPPADPIAEEVAPDPVPEVPAVEPRPVEPAPMPCLERQVPAEVEEARGEPAEPGPRARPRPCLNVVSRPPEDD